MFDGKEDFLCIVRTPDWTSTPYVLVLVIISVLET
jgi:hypothetical protein